MAQFNIVRRPARTGASLKDAESGVLTFDATMNESGTDAIEVTKHPVEQGIEITDHSQPEPTKLSLSGVFTNTPLGDDSPEVNRDIRLYESLRALQAKREPVTVVTGIRIYQDMIITSVGGARDSGSGQEINVTVEFQQVRFAQQAVVPVPPGILRAKKRSRGTSKRDAGRQGGDEAGTVEAAKTSSDAAAAEAVKAENPPPGEESGSLLNSMFG